MEGIIERFDVLLRTKNHPSAYGGYADLRDSNTRLFESSLRIWRVWCCRREGLFDDRIIPPHMEGILKKINVF